MIRLKQSTSSQEVPLGPFVDATDGATIEDGLGPIAATDIKLWKNGATAMVNASGTAVFMVDGTYVLTLDGTDTDTLGPLVIVATPAGARPVRVECEVLPQVIFNTMLGNDIAAAQGLIQIGFTVASGVVGLDPTSTSIPVAVDFVSQPDVFTNANQLRGKQLIFTCNVSNSVGAKAMGARIVANTAKSGSFPNTTSTLTVEPPLPAVPLPGDVFIMLDGALPAMTATSLVKASIEALIGSTQAATNLRGMALASAFGTLGVGSTTTVLQFSSLTPAPTGVDQLRGRVVLFVDDAGSENGIKLQGGRIASNTTTSITLEQPLTTAPNSGNVFIIV